MTSLHTTAFPVVGTVLELVLGRVVVVVVLEIVVVVDDAVVVVRPHESQRTGHNARKESFVKTWLQSNGE